MIRISGGAVMALAAVALIAAVIFLVDRRATDRALEDVERQNNEAADQSDRARGAYVVCIDGGGLWDYGAGKCKRAAPDRGR